MSSTVLKEHGRLTVDAVDAATRRWAGVERFRGAVVSPHAVPPNGVCRGKLPRTSLTLCPVGDAPGDQVVGSMVLLLLALAAVALTLLLFYVFGRLRSGHVNSFIDSGLSPPPGHIMHLKEVEDQPHQTDRLDVHSKSAHQVSNHEDRQHIVYRTRSGLYCFEFSIEKISPGAWRIFIITQPDYASRSEDAHITHRLSDYSSGRRYVCWDSPIRTLDEAIKIAVAWAEGTEAYIRYGKQF